MLQPHFRKSKVEWPRRVKSFKWQYRSLQNLINTLTEALLSVYSEESLLTGLLTCNKIFRMQSSQTRWHIFTLMGLPIAKIATSGALRAHMCLCHCLVRILGWRHKCTIIFWKEDSKVIFAEAGWCVIRRCHITYSPRNSSITTWDNSRLNTLPVGYQNWFIRFKEKKTDVPNT